MDRRTYPIEGDESHVGMAFRMASSKEQDAYRKTFPDPVPSTHYLEWGWFDDAHGGRELRFEMRPKAIGAEGEGDDACDRAATSPQAHLESERKRLEGKTAADLLALAAEVGAEVHAKMTKAQMIAAILEKAPAKK